MAQILTSRPRPVAVATAAGVILVACLAAAPSRADGLAIGPWQSLTNGLHISAPGRNVYYMTDSPVISGRGTVEADVVIGKRPFPGGWATAGLLLAAGPSDFWNLGLVEGPDGTHYIELVEDHSGVHQAQNTGATRLSPIEGTFGDGWDYGKHYRVRLTLSRDRIVGEVFATGQTGGEAKPIARLGYLLAGSSSVTAGWGALRCDDFAATFTRLRVAAPTTGAELHPRAYPHARHGCVGIYLGSDLPGAEKAPSIAGFRRRLAAAGFASVVLTSEDLTRPGTFAYPGLSFFAADLRRMPAQAVTPMMTWLRRGGVLVSLTAPAFGGFYWRSNARWLDWETYVQHGIEADASKGKSILTWSKAELARWTQSYAVQAKQATVELEPGVGPSGQEAAELVVPHFDSGWWSINRDFEQSPAGPGQVLTCFWAKGDAHTCAMSIEWAEKDGSRWVAVVTLEPKWRFFALPPAAFQYWGDNPSKGRGGAGDHVHMDHVDHLAFGISASHTPGVLYEAVKEHHIWLTAPAMAAAPPGALVDATMPMRPDMEALSPGYKLHEIKDAATCRPTVAGRVWGLGSDALPVVPALGANERPRGDGFDRGRWWRWVPLAEVRDKSGRDRGAPLSVIISGMLPLPRSAWVSLGLTHIADLARPAIQGAVVSAMARLADRPVLFEGGAKGFLYRPGEAMTVGAHVTSFAASASAAQVTFTVTNTAGKVVAQTRALKATVAPRTMATVETTLHGLPEGDYAMTTALAAGGKTVDRITQSLQVRPRLTSPPKPQEVVVRRRGELFLDGKPWHPVSCNYWPHYLGGIPGGAYGLSYLDPVLYEPSVIDADLAQMEKWGFKAIAGVGADAHWTTGADTPLARDLQDFLWRCQAHHIKVFLYVAGLDPRGRNSALARQVIRGVRYHPAIAGYDIAWEPGYYSLRHRYDPDWREWLVAQYGNLDAAQKSLGYALPRDEKGQVIGPSDKECSTDGPWHAVVAAYRAFMDWQLGAEYRRSADIIRSLDPLHLIGFRGSTVDSVVSFRPVQQPAVLHFMDWAGPEGYDVPAYGRVSPWPVISRKGLVTRMLHFLSGGKPVIWMEFGLPIYPNGTPWADKLIWVKPERYQYQVTEGRHFWEMMVHSGAWGDFIWWYPGGFRVGENSDCGLVDPDNAPRPVAAVARAFVPKFAASEHFTANRSLAFTPEDDIGGWVGEYLRLRDEYAGLVESGHDVDVRTAGQGLTSADCPLIDDAGRPWPGKGPLRYLDAIFERVRVRAGEGPWQEVELPTKPGPVAVKLAGSGPVEVEAWAGNLAEAKWLAAGTEPGQAGAASATAGGGQVALAITGAAGARAPLEDPTSFQGSGHFAPVRLQITAGKTPAHLRLQLTAGDRAAFGEILNLSVTGG